MRRWAHRTHLTALLVAAAFACGREAREHPSAPAERIVSLSPAATELLFALGAGARVVGRTTWCDYPPAALAVPSVGDGLNPNIEAVVARRPDLVILYRSPLDQTATAQLASLGIPAVVLELDRLEQLGRAARTMGRLTGRERAGDSLAGAIGELLARPAPAPRVRLAFVVWDNPPVVIGGGSYLDQLAKLAGAANVFEDVTAASASVGLESIAARDPDVIAVPRDTAGKDAGPPAFIRRPEWQAIRAIREHRLVYLRGSLFSWPSPRAGEAAAELERLLADAKR
jgi:ABC-type Fe3+-hydroxamate transport system substrate-binding protein